MSDFGVPVAMVFHRAYIVAEEPRHWFSDPGHKHEVAGTITRFRLRCGKFGEMSTLNLRKAIRQTYAKHCEIRKDWKEENDDANANPDPANI